MVHCTSLIASPTQLLSRDLKRCQPLAKMASVLLTLLLVCLSEYVSHKRRRRIINQQSGESSRLIPATLFCAVGFPYLLAFLGVSFCLHFHQDLQRASTNLDATVINDDNLTSNSGEYFVGDVDVSYWKALGFVQYMAIESYGSISVAAFWSYTNSRFDTISAGRYYGVIISAAQVGAILGATVVSEIGKIAGGMTLVYVICSLLVIINMLTMSFYSKRFPDVDGERKGVDNQISIDSRTNHFNGSRPLRPSVEMNSPGSAFFSGIYLILKHRYVLFILGLSCLFEVPMTCLDYYMKLVGLARFQSSALTRLAGQSSDNNLAERTFASFMGNFGQLTNVLSLLLSSVGFPFLIQRFGLRYTIRIFPIVLLCSSFLVFAAKPNLWLVFFTLAFLKSLIYSIHGPATEILYIPTSNTVKLKSKFWIDVVGNRFAKALGSSITIHAAQTGAERVAAYAAAPSILASILLMALSMRIGDKFENLVQSSEIVGREDEMIEDDMLRNEYQILPTDEDNI